MTAPSPVTFPTRAEFEAWLTKRKPHAIVGRSGQPDACPVARAIRAKHRRRHSFVEVGARGWSFDALDVHVVASLPGWARDFIQFTDASPEPDRYACNLPITATRALEILRGIPA